MEILTWMASGYQAISTAVLDIRDLVLGLEEASVEEKVGIWGQEGEDMEVEEVEPPATEPGTMVFPKVRRELAADGAVLTQLPRRPAPSAQRRRRTVLDWAVPGPVVVHGAGTRRSSIRW